MKDSKKKFIIIAVCFCVALGIGFGIKAVVKSIQSKVLDVAFLDLPDQITVELETQIKKIYQGKIKFYDLDKSSFNTNKAIKKYDYFFSWENEITESLKDVASFIPPECASYMPDSIFARRTTSVPLLLNHFQVAYNDTVRHAAKIRYPASMEQFEIYLNWIKEYVLYPFYCAGGDDETLCALLTCFVESFGGTESYERLCKVLDGQQMLKDVVDVSLNEKAGNVSLHTVLDILRKWQDAKLLPENWIASTKNDVKNFILDDCIGVLFSTLSYYRTIPNNKVSMFAADRFPVNNMTTSHSIIAPTVIGMQFTKSSVFGDVLTKLVTDDVQSELSLTTTYAPVASHARVYDRQADDVRFLAAACAGGPKPVCNISEELLRQIRYYIKTGIIINS